MVAKTTYELTGEWTSSDDSDLIVQQIANETNAILDVIGQSYLGRNIYSLTVGTGDNLMMVTGGVHRSEPASREAVLIKARDVAYNLTGLYTDYLSNHKIMFIPTVQLDNNNSRHNAQGLNINRDAYSLQTPEMRALMTVVTRENPELFIDFHEKSGSYVGVEFINALALDPNSDKLVRNGSVVMDRDIRGSLEGLGYGTKPYPQGGIGPGKTVAIAGILGSLTATPETNMEVDVVDFRVNALKDTFDEYLKWHSENGALITEIRDLDKYGTLKPGDAFILLNGNNEYYTNATRKQITAPEGYMLGNIENFEVWKNVYNIEISEDGFVPINQKTGRLLPHLLDPQSDMAVTVAERVEPDRTDTKKGRWTKVMYDEWKDVFIRYT